MRNAVMVLFVLICILISGCAMLEGIAPSQFDEQGNVIAGTHQLTDQGQAIVSNTGVMGGLATAIPLLVWNFVEIYKSKKKEKGLISTVKALKSASTDPEVVKAWATIKEYLEQAHDVAGVKQYMQGILASIK